MIPKLTIDQIFDAVIIEDVIGEFVPLKKRGANYLGNCPFHNEKTPSFTVSPAKGIYKCFGCGKAGNSVNFIMEHEHYSYPEALRFLAKKYGIEVEEEEMTPEQKEAADERESLYVVSNYASNYFKKQIHETDEGKAIGLSYFLERGFNEEVINNFQLGYCPDNWSDFTDSALKEGYNLSYLEKTGLTIVKGDKKFDRFKGRVIFPIHNLSGRVLGFGGRILKSQAKAAKYVNSPESEIYDKSKVLYGIYFAKKSITQENLCYLVEGYTDVISLHQAGVENVVSSSGTSLTEGQIRLIKRFTPNITILYDGDTAGIKASFRGIDMILKEGMNVRVVLFPEGEDPDSYAKNHDQQELKEYISSGAQDFIRFKVGVLLNEAQNDPIKKAELIKDIVESISIVPDQIKRSVYIKECSGLLDIEEQTLINETNKLLRKKISKRNHSNDGVNTVNIIDQQSSVNDYKKETNFDDLEHWEFEIVRLLMSYGNEKMKIEVVNTDGIAHETEILVATYIIQNIESDRISFLEKTYQVIYEIYVEGLNKNEPPVHEDFINSSNTDISQLAINMFASKYELSPNWKTHNIFTTTEEQQIKKAVYNTMFAFKKSKLRRLIIENQEKLKTEGSQEVREQLLQEQIHLKKIDQQLALKLGRVV